MSARSARDETATAARTMRGVDGSARRPRGRPGPPRRRTTVGVASISSAASSSPAPPSSPSSISTSSVAFSLPLPLSLVGLWFLDGLLPSRSSPSSAISSSPFPSACSVASVPPVVSTTLGPGLAPGSAVRSATVGAMGPRVRPLRRRSGVPPFGLALDLNSFASLASLASLARSSSVMRRRRVGNMPRSSAPAIFGVWAAGASRSAPRSTSEMPRNSMRERVLSRGR